MQYFPNKSETFFREVRSIDIFFAEDYTFQENMSGSFPTKNPVYRLDVVPEDFDRRLQPKKRNGNRYTDVDLNFPLLDLSMATVEELQSKLNRKGFAVLITSNTEKTILGNNREPLRVDLVDGKKDNNSGNDQYNISITGATVVPVKTKDL